jgi:hypothetical protein
MCLLLLNELLMSFSGAFYDSVVYHYLDSKQDFSQATKNAQILQSLAISTGNTIRQMHCTA